MTNTTIQQELLDLPKEIKSSSSLIKIRQLAQEEIRLVIQEYPSKFLLTAHFDELNIKAVQAIRKIEPSLVAISQLNNSKELEDTKDLLLRKLNIKLNDIKNIIQGRIQ